MIVRCTPPQFSLFTVTDSHESYQILTLSASSRQAGHFLRPVFLPHRQAFRLGDSFIEIPVLPSGRSCVKKPKLVHLEHLEDITPYQSPWANHHSLAPSIPPPLISLSNLIKPMPVSTCGYCKDTNMPRCPRTCQTDCVSGQGVPDTGWCSQQ